MSVYRLSKDRTLINLSNSIFKYFGISGPHPDSFPDVDEVLLNDKNRGKKLCVLLIEGWSEYVYKKAKNKSPFLHSKQAISLESVYPTCSFCNNDALLYGTYPCYEGRLGEVQYFSKADQYVNMVDKVIQGTSTKSFLTEPNKFYKSKLNLLQNICVIKEKKDAAVYLDSRKYINVQGKISSGLFFSAIEEKIQSSCVSFILARWSQLQNDILENGYRSFKTKTSIQVLDESIKTLTERNPETLFIVVGDHGSVKTSWIDIRKYPDFIDTLVEPRFSISPRFASFRVKEGKKEEFEKCFRTHFSKYFELYNKEQVYRENIFGYGSNHELFDEFIGDYILISKGKKSFTDGSFKTLYKYYYGGVTKREKNIVLSFFNNK